ncbi:unnamed protein product [Arabidopsis halleri]
MEALCAYTPMFFYVHTLCYMCCNQILTKTLKYLTTNFQNFIYKFKNQNT